MREKDYSISLLRMIAVISIIFCHSFEYSSSIFVDKGWILKSIGNYLANGVQVFLIISGFLYGNICGSKKNLFSNSKERINFLIKNSLKILKDYWLYCILVIFPVYFKRVNYFDKKRSSRDFSYFKCYRRGTSSMVYSIYIILLFFNTIFIWYKRISKK